MNSNTSYPRRQTVLVCDPEASPAMELVASSYPKRGIVLVCDPDTSPAMKLVTPSRWIGRVSVVLATCFFIGPLLMLLVPWQQNLSGLGKVVAYAPLERQQQVEAPIDGRVVNWWVQEGSTVVTGDRLLEIRDVDPNLLNRLEQERSAVRGKLEAYVQKASFYQLQVVSLEETRDSKIIAARFRIEMGQQDVRVASESLTAAEAARHAAQAQFERNTNLLEAGIVSQRQFEVAQRDLEVAQTGVRGAKAKLTAATNEVNALKTELDQIRADAQAKIDSTRAELSNAQGQTEDARASLAKIEVQLSRQRSQLVAAPRDGTVFRLLANQGGEIVKAGDPLLTLVPDVSDRAVELWVDGNDAPLINAGSAVRLQFEGWPAVQFVGWPAVAVGTFGGQVALVDATDDGQGKFRLLVMPDESDEAWPDVRFLRQGVRAKGWVLLNQVALGYEIWRQLNGFPPVINVDEPKPDIARKRLK